MTPPPRPAAPAGAATDFSELVHYTPEQIEAAGWLPFSARTLRDKASARVFPHSKAGGRITFLLRHIREIAAMHEVRPASERKRPIAADDLRRNTEAGAVRPSGG